MREVTIPPCTCPYCEAEFNTAIDVFNHRNSAPGDIAICGHCSMMVMFDHRMEIFKLPPGEEVKRMNADPHYMEALYELQRIVRSTDRRPADERQ